MRDRIDPLIEERAPWLASGSPLVRPVRAALDRALSYRRTLELGERYRDMATHDFMAELGQMLARDVTASGLHNIPRHGPALIVANHPTGIADGIVLWHLLAPLRPDLYFYANRDILRVLPQMADVIAPVEWRVDKRTHAKTRETMAFTKGAVEAGRLGIIFPSGRLAKRVGLRLHERPWMASAAMLARKFELPVIPVNIRARNSVLFYLFDLIHPTLRDITLFHEMLNKDRQPYVVTVGEEISPASLPASSDEGIAMLRRATLALGGRADHTVSMISATRKPALRF
ncbi:lysophospholipid acyltransferase family protein [Rubellimicrobium sp. CFH 75288]|uniref:lysophospholipid acyltransferase family protein n=1 Tax=Rubellimicrobium sp. CFH 75288 TaxID=2697034 RepID=UPI001412D5DC|nr:lysophospholipid acyltransferase family protein [Rubellimicrobium sp. CFH 75288]NAZ35372.1 glycerol acyltransferase [Rubellimicrobium sp. CFH 75288]